MKMPEDDRIVLVHEDPVLFREAVNFTAAETLFIPGLIEKDYFCTLLLKYLMSANDALVFKGGTCLAKVYAGFYRLSEDLDFVISMAADASRSERSRQAIPLKTCIDSLSEERNVFHIIQSLTGANSSTQYVAVVGYRSLLGEREEIIKIEIGLREPLCKPAVMSSAKTILLNPVSGKAMIQPLHLPCISFEEAMAEKFRAAISRREIAIRDFYDIDHAVRVLGLNPIDDAFVELVKKKLSVPGNDPVDLTGARLDLLRRQLDSQLRPVLRREDFTGFDLERAVRIVSKMAARLE